MMTKQLVQVDEDIHQLMKVDCARYRSSFNELIKAYYHLFNTKIVARDRSGFIEHLLKNHRKYGITSFKKSDSIDYDFDIIHDEKSYKAGIYLLPEQIPRNFKGDYIIVLIGKKPDNLKAGYLSVMDA